MILKSLDWIKSEGVMPGSELFLSDVRERVSSGLTLVDLAIGGGWPVGRFIEIFGPESAGKSTLATHSMIACQKAGGVSLMVESEPAFTRDRAIKMGWDPASHVQCQPDTLEDGFKMIDENTKKLHDNGYGPILVVWDTIAAAPTQAELSGDTYGQGMAKTPRIIHEAFRTLSLVLPQRRAVFLILNQVRACFDGYGGLSTPGGWALKHYPSLRLMLKSGKPFELGESPYGMDVEIYIKKSKVSRPRGKISAVLTYDLGFDEDWTNLKFLTEKGIVVTSKGWYSFSDEMKNDGFSKSSFRWADWKTVITDDQRIKLRDLIVSRGL